MAYWKVIALINGDIEAISGPAAQDRPGAHEWMVWQGTVPLAEGKSQFRVQPRRAPARGTQKRSADLNLH